MMVTTYSRISLASPTYLTCIAMGLYLDTAKQLCQTVIACKTAVVLTIATCHILYGPIAVAHPFDPATRVPELPKGVDGS